MFYEVVHLIERVFAVCPPDTIKIHSSNHKKRYDSLRLLRGFVPISILQQYKTLYDASIDARYENNKVSWQDFKNIRNQEYKDLKNYFRDLYKQLKN